MSENEKPESSLPFGQRGDANRILEMAKNQVVGQTISAENLEKAQKRIAEEGATNDQQEAAAFCEELIAWLNEQFLAREFTAEQRIFAVSLATINLRQHFPEDKGGKEYFDRISKTAWEYFAKAAV